MSTHLLLEAAMRTVVMGAIIFIALRLLRIEQVRARRTAWLLALAGALAMPLLVAAQIGPRLLPDIAFSKAADTHTAVSRSDAGVTGGTEVTDGSGGAVKPQAGGLKSHWVHHGSIEGLDEDGPPGASFGETALSLAIIGYCVVAAVLALRLCAGVGFALRLRNQAERVIFPFDPELDTRASGRLATPVTIGSSVLLPKNYGLWDGATLRIVLSHERAHVRQKDFYVQTLARLHCALFWFNPFSWWLQRQLSELGEALSDCAAVEQAESRASYAETLLAFATRNHWPLTSVAMAGASNLTPRIERLLNEQGFERSFAPKQRLPFIAAGVVLLAMVASTSMVRVHAADSAAPAGAAAPANPAATASAAAPASPSAPNVQPTKRHTKGKKRLADATESVEVDSIAMEEAADRAEREADRAAEGHAAREASHAARDADVDAKRGADGEVLAIRSGRSHITINSGGAFARGTPQSGDYIYFQHNGKPYLIQDPQIIAQAEAMLAPMQELGEKQKELGREQALLGAQQQRLATQQRSIRIVETPDFKREMDELQTRLKEVDLPKLTAQIDEQALARVQAHLGEIQARVGHLQAEMGLQGDRLGEEMSKFGEQQGKLGEQQALLGEQERKIIEETTRQLKPIIEQAIQEGKGKALSPK